MNVQAIGLPFIAGPVNSSCAADGGTPADSKCQQIQSLTQLVLSLDMEQWEALVEVFDIQSPMIANEK